MKLISWNCQGAFRKKADAILAEQPDILVVSECEHPDKLIFNTSTPLPNDVIWFGDNKNKGLGIFSYSNYKFQLRRKFNKEIKLFLPVKVTGGDFDFHLFAVWANNPNDPDGQYIEQVWKGIHHYNKLLGKGPVLLTGDFNSNTIWDKPRRIGNHSAVVEKLANKEIYSVYHKHLNQVQGKELHPTFFLHRNVKKPYHLDYCFASADLYNKVTHLEIGKSENWIKHSDHLPLIIQFDI